MADDETLKCMLAAQIWMHSLDAIGDMLEARANLNRGLSLSRALSRSSGPEPTFSPSEEVLASYAARYLAEANSTLKKITPTMIECASIVGPDAGESIRGISTAAQNAADSLLQRIR
jgi:hypothetical protein